jgi:rhodanese-related sulfurtransferase
MFPLRTLELRVVERTDIAVDAIPDGAVVLDLRPVHLFRRNHFPGALHLEYGMALEAMGALDRTRTYVLYCEVGFKSAFVAAEMRKAGIDASHVRGGMKTLVKNMDRLSGRPAP